MINTGGWIFLTIIFTTLIVLVMRSEKKRRNVSLVIMLFVWSTVWGYGIYRIQRECDSPFPVVCNSIITREKFNQIAWNTTNRAALTAIVVSWLFWFLIGRYNPPRSSDETQVLTLKNAPLQGSELLVSGAIPVPVVVPVPVDETQAPKPQTG